MGHPLQMARAEPRKYLALLDKNGNTVVKYTYDAWGNHTVEDGTECGLGTLNPFRYRGYYYDTETGLYYLQTRYYDPEIGRFVTIDDVAYLDPDTVGGLNLYAYCNNNPVMCVDPMGTFLWNVLIGVVVGGLWGCFTSRHANRPTDEELSAVDESEREKIENDYDRQVLLDTIAGALSGGFSGTRFGRWGQAIFNAVVGAFSGFFSEEIDSDEDTTTWDYVWSAIFGGFTSGFFAFLGGAGTASNHVKNAVGRFWGKVRSFSFKKLINGEYFADVLNGFSYLFSQTSKQSFKDAKNTVIGIFKGSIFDWIETIFTWIGNNKTN